MPDSGLERFAVLLGVGLSLLVEVVMLFPIGGRFETVSEPGRPTESFLQYWSFGSDLFLGPITGGVLKYLNIGSILVGLALSVLAGALFLLAGDANRAGQDIGQGQVASLLAVEVGFEPTEP